MLKRIKRRYLAIQVESNEKLNQRDLLDGIWRSITRLYGEYGASQTGLVMIDFNETEKSGIIRVYLKVLLQVRASLASITMIKDMPVAIHVVSVAGTIKSLHKQ